MSLAHAQSFNIDLDEMGGTEQTGNGSPSSAFGGAAGISGTWNRIFAGGPVNPVTLVGLDGLPTGCQIYTTNSTGTYGGYNNPNLSGDFRLLMADGKDIGTPVQYHFTGFQPGHYSIYTYGASAHGDVLNLFVDVPGSTTPRQTVTGPMPPMQFAYGFDYCTHELNLTSSSFEVDASTDVNIGPVPSLHGFQVVYTPVPEPFSLFTLSVGFVAIAAMRRQRV